VRYLLDGSLAMGAGRIRVNAQLIDAAADTHVWAERFDQQAGADPLLVQDLIVGRLARQVELRMVLAEARRAAAAAPDAAGLALQGYGAAIMSRMAPQGVAAAREMFHRALALDAASIEAAAGLAALEAYALVNGFTPAVERAARLAEADGLSRRVLAADPEHLGALRARAVVLRAQGWFRDAIVCARAILALCPRDPPASREIGLNHLYLGAPEEALVWFRQAEHGGPSDPARWSWMQGMGRALLQLRRPAEAVEALRVVVDGNPDWAFGHGLLAAALLLDGDAEAARARFAEFARRQPEAAARAPERLIPVPPERVSADYHRH
jgi:adenylate cyclase